MVTKFTGWPRGTEISLQLEESGWGVMVFLPFWFAEEARLPSSVLRGHGRTMPDALLSVEQKARELIEARPTAAVSP